MATKDTCKYILHFTEKSILSVRIETDDPQEILLYISETVKGYASTQVCEMFDIAVFSSIQSEGLDSENFYLGIVPTNVKIKAGDIVTKVNPTALTSLLSREKEFILPVQPLSISEIENFFNSSVVGFKKLSTVDWFTKQLTIKTRVAGS